MNKEFQQVKDRAAKLRETIRHHRYLYHVLDKQKISDAALDSLKHELAELEREHPELITADSPTQRVGGEPLPSFEKVQHATRMLSMEDVFSFEELQKWEERGEKVASHKIAPYFCMTKIDGLALSLRYINGALTVAATRGNGRIGENVTQNAKTLNSIPLQLRVPSVKELTRIADFDGDGLFEALKSGELEIRGEVYMDTSDFEVLNEQRIKDGEAEFANPRNVCAGSIRQLDPKVAAQRPLKFRAWHLSDIGQISQSQSMELLKLLGFKTANSVWTSSLKDAETYYETLEKKREKLNYWIDGLVVRVDRFDYYEALGVAGKAPRGLVAWKFAPEEATTKLTAVDWQMGRTGKLTPVATVNPVFLNGTTVQHATLHNIDEINRLGLKIGDTVIIKKAGDIIPKITTVLTELRTGEELDIVEPEVDDSHRRAMQREQILHAARCFDMDGLGGKTIERFLEEGIIQDFADLFTLTLESIVQLERFAEISAKNITQEILSHKTVDLIHFIRALNIPNIGEETARTLAYQFHSVEGVQSATNEQLLDLQDIGEIVAQDVVEYFADPINLKYIDRLIEYGVTVKEPEKLGTVLRGKKFVVTGTLQTYSREEIKELIRKMGGAVSSSVSKNTDYLVVGENPGSKAEKAKTLGVEVLSEEAFRRKLE